MQLEKGSIKDFDNFYNLYKLSFPKNEQKPKLMLKNAIKSGRYDLFVLYDEELFAGFMLSVPVKDSDIVMLDYLAVNTNARQKGYGTFILNEVVKQYDNKKIFLACEMIDETAQNNEQRIKRLGFYHKNGWKNTGLLTDGASGKMYVMSFNPITENEYLLAQTYALGNTLMKLGKMTVSYNKQLDEFI